MKSEPRALRHFEYMMSNKLQASALEFSCALIGKQERPCLAATVRTNSQQARFGPNPTLTGSVISHVIYQVLDAGTPIWALDRKTAEVLMTSDLPVDRYDDVPPLPHTGIYVELPEGLYEIHNDDTGMHRVTAIYVAEDWQISEGVWERAWVIAAIGESKGTVRVHGTDVPDDALIHFGVYPRSKILTPSVAKLTGAEETMRIVVNLLHCWRTKHIRARSIVPTAPKSPKKRKRAVRRGKSFRPYSYLELFSREPSKKSGASGRKRSLARRRAYWNHYWVREVGDDVSLATRLHPRSGNTLHKVARFILPFVGASTEPIVRRIKI